jgi:hypothetical protein
MYLLATDDRAFDAKLVKSALDFLGRFYLVYEEMDLPLAGEMFAWVPEVITSRAGSVGIKVAPRPLKLPASAGACNTLATVMRIAIGDIQARDDESMDAHTREAKEEWLGKKFSGMQRTQVPIYRQSKWDWATIPVLRTVEDCVIYALFILHENTWGFRERVHMCPYRERADTESHIERDHWFLDFEVDERGALKLGAAKAFCTVSHGNAYRQREWRKQQAAAKHK